MYDCRFCPQLPRLSEALQVTSEDGDSCKPGCDACDGHDDSNNNMLFTLGATCRHNAGQALHAEC